MVYWRIDDYDEVVKVGRAYETYFASRSVGSFEYIQKSEKSMLPALRKRRLKQGKERVTETANSTEETGGGNGESSTDNTREDTTRPSPGYAGSGENVDEDGVVVA